MMTIISRYVDVRRLPLWCVLSGLVLSSLWSFLFAPEHRSCTTGDIDGAMCRTRHGYLSDMTGADLASDVLLIGGLGLAAFGVLLALTVRILDRRLDQVEARERETVEAE